MALAPHVEQGRRKAITSAARALVLVEVFPASSWTGLFDRRHCPSVVSITGSFDRSKRR
jgi:hypothetical protein